MNKTLLVVNGLYEFSWIDISYISAQWSKSFYGKFKFGFIYFISTIDRGWNLITLLHLVLTQNVYVVIHIRRQTVSLSQNENTPRWVIVWNVGGLETPPIKRFSTLCATSGQLFITQLLHDEYLLHK